MKNTLSTLGLKKLIQVSALIIGATLGFSAQAATSVAWTSPSDGSTYTTGTNVALEGVASAKGTIGTGLDLVIVLDGSGSMGSTNCSSGVPSVCKSRDAWQREAAIALVESLPSGTSVGVVEFDSTIKQVKVLTSLNSDKASVIAFINTTGPRGGTLIGLGINEAAAQLTGPNHTPGASQQMIVFSDGASGDNPGLAAANAISAAIGVDAVHSVALPGASIVTMQNIADNGNGTLIDARADVGALAGFFSGSGTSLVGLDRVEVTLPNGSTIIVPADAFGNFDLSAIIASGANTFIATAFATDGTSASDTITLFGIDNNPSPNPVPVPASLPLLAFALLGFAAIRRRMIKK